MVASCIMYITDIFYLLMKSTLNSDCQPVMVTDFCLSLFCLAVLPVFQHQPGSADYREHGEYHVSCCLSCPLSLNSSVLEPN